jgi:hypothetical protein
MFGEPVLEGGLMEGIGKGLVPSVPARLPGFGIAIHEEWPRGGLMLDLNSSWARHVRDMMYFAIDDLTHLLDAWLEDFSDLSYVLHRGCRLTNRA